MIVFHVFVDYNFLVAPLFDLGEGVLFAVGRTAAVLFVGLAGTSCVLFPQRKKLSGEALQKKLFERGVKIFLVGVGITLATWWVFPAYTIWFGVLHLMGVGIATSGLLVGRKWMSGLLGGVLAAVGVWLSLPAMQAILPVWHILLPIVYPTFDYFPLFPWLGIFWLGMFAGENIVERKGLHVVKERTPSHAQILGHFSFVKKGLVWMGRHSLGIYLLHQPILVGILAVVFHIPILPL
jgi:uncharacterized membrane protein